jgi:hypothetical protein
VVYVCKKFVMQELVDEVTFNSTAEWKLWLAFDDRLLRLIDAMRLHFNVAMTINDWLWNEDDKTNYTESGLRVPGMKYYKQWSQHSFGRAVDIKFEGLTAHYVRKELKKLYETGMFDHITVSITCEEGKNITWVHLDVRNGPAGYNSIEV